MGKICGRHNKEGSEGRKAGSSSYATLVTLVTNHLYIAIDAPVRSPAGERERVVEEKKRKNLYMLLHLNRVVTLLSVIVTCS